MNNGLSALVYASKATSEMSDADLESLLSASRERNGKLGITGILVYSGGSFMQVLEGSASTVEDLFNNGIAKTIAVA